jgi:hypothetical protein
MPDYDDTLSKACTDLADDWVTMNNTGEGSMKIAMSTGEWPQWTTQQKVHMIEHILEKTKDSPLSLTSVAAMDKMYKLSESLNSEVDIP